MLAVALVAVLACAWRWGPRAWDRAGALWAQRQCLVFAPPPGQDVYSSVARDDDPFSPTVTVQAPPACWVVFRRGVSRPLAFPAAAADGLDGPFQPYATAPAFLHGRDAGGGRRLVVAQVGEQLLAGKGHRVICCRVFEPATWRRDPVLLWEGTTIITSSFEWGDTLRVRAGAADDADPTHFSIALDVGGDRKTLHGWLQPDETVRTELTDESPAN